ncbi:endonuclease/exonuclease/phosphatase family protein [Caulobacter sp. BK020]|uniref:endonuclease/exonuclease/phosphatase family protein n=1 Tax=Caulobacter sp. BK020 TaxID=2512117 RepID=UPI0010525426|nr:endonuclease/exonuclease/phosphatase family protein [Caulobacter sp. BK020]TCS14978.1 endonuclease/exonuclease/phosphatase (EEP) superfamily protein YafD [Caulobacter sp. BK020]
MRLILHLANLFLRGTALMLGLVGAVAGLACLGGAFSDWLDVLTHAAPLWMACSLLGLALALLASRDDERRALAGVAALGIAALVVLMAPELLSTLRPPEKPAKGAATLKLVQFNLWAENDAPPETAAWILKQNADVVITEESGGNAWRVLRTLKTAYPYSTKCYAKYGCDTRIHSRWPIVDEHDFYGDGESLVATRATLRVPGGDVTVVGAHFVWPIPAGRWQAQSRLLASKIAPFPKDSLIVTGDFNATPWSWSLRRQDKALGLERRTHALATWPTGQFIRIATAPFPVLPIDQVYAGTAWKTVKVERGPSLGSDHRPVVAIFTR